MERKPQQGPKLAKNGNATVRQIPQADIDRVVDKAIQRESKYFRLPRGNPENGNSRAH